MRFTLSLVRDGKLGRQESQACLTANLGLPGAGSLMAGRWVGYGQLLVAVLGLGLTLVFGVKFLAWCVRNLDQLRAPDVDPSFVLTGIWRELRWVLAGFGLFGVAWCWALGTSLLVMRKAQGD